MFLRSTKILTILTLRFLKNLVLRISHRFSVTYKQLHKRFAVSRKLYLAQLPLYGFSRDRFLLYAVSSLGSTQPLKEMGTKEFLSVIVHPGRTAENSVVLILPNVKGSMEPQLHLPTEPSRLLMEKLKKSQYVGRIQLCEGYNAIWITYLPERREMVLGKNFFIFGKNNLQDTETNFILICPEL